VNGRATLTGYGHYRIYHDDRSVQASFGWYIRRKEVRVGRLATSIPASLVVISCHSDEVILISE